jgi:hypothetical protein
MRPMHRLRPDSPRATWLQCTWVPMMDRVGRRLRSWTCLVIHRGPQGATSSQKDHDLPETRPARTLQEILPDYPNDDETADDDDDEDDDDEAGGGCGNGDGGSDDDAKPEPDDDFKPEPDEDHKPEQENDSVPVITDVRAPTRSRQMIDLTRNDDPVAPSSRTTPSRTTPSRTTPSRVTSDYPPSSRTAGQSSIGSVRSRSQDASEGSIRGSPRPRRDNVN